MSTFSDTIGIIKSKLTSSQARPLFNQKDDIATEQARLVAAKKLYDYYTFNRRNILDYLGQAMKSTFKSATIKTMQFPLYNLTKKIIDQLAVAYLLPAERYVVVKKAREVNNTENLVVSDTRDERDNEVYQEILSSSNINASAKLWNRLAKLQTTVYVGIIYREDKIDYEVFPAHGITVKPDPNNYLEPIEVRYERAVGDSNYEFVWTKDTYKVLDKDGRMVQGDVNDWDGVNKYGVIPIIACRLSVPGDHWGDGDTELVYLNEKLNILIASMFHNLLLQSHGVAFGVNLNLGNSKPEDGGNLPQVQTGPSWMIEVNDVKKDDVTPSLEFLHPDPALEENLKAAEWIIKTTAVMKGLSAQNVSLDVNDSSGRAKIIDLAELRERRQDDLEFLRPFEKRLFEITRVVWNTHNIDKISDKAIFGIDFVEPEPIVSEKEKLEVRQLKVDAGLISPLEGMIDEDEGIDEEQAMSYMMDNIERSSQIMKKRMEGTVSVDLIDEPEGA